MCEMRLLQTLRFEDEDNEEDDDLYVTCTSSIMHFICPPEFCITFLFYFSWVLQPSQEKLRTMLMQDIGGQIMHYGRLKVAYSEKIGTQESLVHVTFFPTRNFWTVTFILLKEVKPSPD